MKKKTYEQPKISIIEVKAADIICTSTLADFQSYELSEDDTFSNW